MNKRNNITKTKHKSLKYLVLFIAVVAVIAGVYIYVSGSKNTNNITSAKSGTINYGPPSQKDEQSESQIKQNDINSESKSNPSNNTPTNNSISLTISRVSQLSVGGDVQIRTIITGTDSGTCKVTFSNGSQSFSESYSVVVSATYSTCSNANVPVSNFSQSGPWNLAIIVTDGNNSSPSVEGSVNVEK